MEYAYKSMLKIEVWDVADSGLTIRQGTRVSRHSEKREAIADDKR